MNEIIEGVVVPLSDEHSGWLESSAIELSTAIEAGVHTIAPGTWGDEWTKDSNRDFMPKIVGERPALVFPWRDPWTDGEAYQLTVYPRDDAWNALDSKYLFERGSGGRAFLHPSEEAKMHRLVDENAPNRRLAIVEGTKQGLAGASYSDEETVVITMAGCWGWREKAFLDGAEEDPTGSLPAKWLIGVLSDFQPTEVVVFIDQDMATNPRVHDAAKGLGESIGFLTGALGREIAPKFASLPGAGGTTGLDDFLAGLPREMRQTAFANLIESAGPQCKPPTKAAIAAKKAASPDADLHVDEDRHMIVDNQPLTDWSARITATRVFSNPLDAAVQPEVTHDIEVTFPDGTTYDVPDLPDEMLSNVRPWLNPLGGGRGSARYVYPGRGVGDFVAQAIRRHREQDRKFSSGFLVTGNFPHPVTGEPGFVTPTGFIGAHRYDPTVTAKVTGKGATIDIPNPHGLSATQIEDGIQSMLDLRDCFNDDLPYLAILSFQFAVLAGMSPQSAPMLVARGGAGKSLLLGACQSMLGPFHRKNLNSFQNTTKGVLNRMAWGLHHVPWVIDDFIPAAVDKPDGGDGEAGLRTLARRSYDGEAASREALEPDGKGGYRAAPSDKATPGFIFGGESSLAQRQTNATTLDRMLVIEMIHSGDATPERPATIKDETSAARIDQVAKDRTLGVVSSAFLRWCQQQRHANPTWVSEWDSDRRNKLIEVTLGEAGTDPRHREVLSTSALGAILLARFLNDVGHFTEDEAVDFQDHVCRGLVDLMNFHVDQFAFGQRSATDRALALLQQIRSKVAAQQVSLPGVTALRANERQPNTKIGALTTGRDGVVRIALDRDTTAEVLGIATDVLVAALRPVCVKTSANKTVRPMNLNGVSGIMSLVIDPDVWSPKGDPKEDVAA